MADMTIALYNPASKKRADCLRRACETVMKYRSPETVCGVARMIGREGEQTLLMTLSELAGYEADMFTTVFIGCSSSKAIEGKMVAPRGYRYEG